MNKQIGELTSMVRALTEKVTNSREENDPNVRNFRTFPHSDSKSYQKCQERVQLVKQNNCLVYKFFAIVRITSHANILWLQDNTKCGNSERDSFVGSAKG